MGEQRSRAFYLNLREKIMEWAERKGVREKKVFKYIVAAPDFFYLLWKLSTDKELPAEDRLLVGIALFYFISPFDLFPEGVMGPIGYLDDIAIAAYVIKKIINRAGEEKVKKYWLGDDDLLLSIERILNTVDQYLGSGLWKRLVNFVERREKKYYSGKGRTREKKNENMAVKVRKTTGKKTKTQGTKSTPQKTAKKKVNKAAKRGRPRKPSGKNKEEK